MKKIVALILALVMVMGLATVASAASYSEETKMGVTTTIAAADKYAVYKADSTDKVGLTVGAYTAMSTQTVTVDGKATTSYIPAYYTVTDANDVVYYLYECDASCADVRVFKGDAFVTYARYDVANVAFVSDAAVKVEKAKGCGNYAVDVYVINGEDAYAPAATGALAIMGGKYVCYDNSAVVTKTPHDFAKLAVTYKSVTDNTIVAIACDKCEKSFTVVANGKIPANYKGAVDTTTLTPVYTILLDTVVEVPAAGDKVESAETFDAGIAMYVGMSVMAAAGSAVVLKKKD